MEINLEKIEMVKERTGVSYKEAKEALEKANGSVVDAIINIEENVGVASDEDTVRSFMDGDIIGKVKETLAKGNMSRIMVRKDDDVILNLPLSAGVLGAFIAPWGIIVGAIAAAGLNCKVEFVNDKGEVTDINGKVKSNYEKVRGMSEETFDKVKETDIYAELKEKIDALDLKDKIDNFDIKETIDTLRNKLEEITAEIGKSDEEADVSASDEESKVEIEIDFTDDKEKEAEEDDENILKFE
jgi:hypothetical protein